MDQRAAQQSKDIKTDSNEKDRKQQKWNQQEVTSQRRRRCHMLGAAAAKAPPLWACLRAAPLLRPRDWKQPGCSEQSGTRPHTAPLTTGRSGITKAPALSQSSPSSVYIVASAVNISSTPLIMLLNTLWCHILMHASGQFAQRRADIKADGRSLLLSTEEWGVQGELGCPYVRSPPVLGHQNYSQTFIFPHWPKQEHPTYLVLPARESPSVPESQPVPP